MAFSRANVTFLPFISKWFKLSRLFVRVRCLASVSNSTWPLSRVLLLSRYRYDEPIFTYLWMPDYSYTNFLNISEESWSFSSVGHIQLANSQSHRALSHRSFVLRFPDRNPEIRYFSCLCVFRHDSTSAVLVRHIVVSLGYGHARRQRLIGR
jgi:hypothetical protein